MCYQIVASFQIGERGTILDLDRELEGGVVGKSILLDGQIYKIKGVPVGARPAQIIRNELFTEKIELDNLIGKWISIV